MVWPPNRVVKIGNGYINLPPFVATDEATRAYAWCACTVVSHKARFLIGKELWQSDAHAEHGHTTATPCEDALLDISVVVGDGIVDDKGGNDAYDAVQVST